MALWFVAWITVIYILNQLVSPSPNSGKTWALIVPAPCLLFTWTCVTQCGWRKIHHDADWSHLKYVITNLMYSVSISSSSISLGYFLFYSLKQQFYNFIFLILLTSYSFFPFFSLLPGNFLPFFVSFFLSPSLSPSFSPCLSGEFILPTSLHYSLTLPYLLLWGKTAPASVGHHIQRLYSYRFIVTCVLVIIKFSILMDYSSQQTNVGL